MENWKDVCRRLKTGELDKELLETGYADVISARKRVLGVLEGFKKSFDADENIQVSVCSAPGRTEICGNHTDHQHGHVLAAAVTLDFLACAAPNGTNKVRFKSEGWPMTVIDISDIEPKEDERETTASLVRGVMAQLKERGYEISGFDMYAVSNVLPGSGLSSSAACEVLIGVVGNHLFCSDELDAVTIAKIGQYAENKYFGKPSGLMDQTASSVGDAVAIDFEDPASPVVRTVEADLKGLGLALCIIDSGADHAALTSEYASIPKEMCSVAEFFGKKVLREVKEEDVLWSIPKLRKEVGDRAVLRALHFYEDDRRAVLEADALERKDAKTFLELVRQSGKSSWELLQNITPAGAVTAQDMAVALAVTEKILDNKGACRVHGGGFAGTIQAFVPLEELDAFKEKTEKILGEGCCHVLDIRKAGGTVILP